MSNAGAWALYCPRTVQHADPVTPADHFVERRGSELFLNGAKFRFASLNAPELLDGDCNGEFEVRDTFAALAAEGAFGTAVTRTYTLRVRPLSLSLPRPTPSRAHADLGARLLLSRSQIKSKNIGRGHINGWSNEWNDWMWDGGRLHEMDLVLAEAAKAGVKLIIPLINQDTGEECVHSLSPCVYVCEATRLTGMHVRAARTGSARRPT